MIQDGSVIENIRGKNLVGIRGQQDVSILLEHIDALEDFLDDCDFDDIFAPEGWRHLILEYGQK